MQSLNIGLAEDDPLLRATLKQMLAALGHAVLCDAENGQRLLELADSTPLDLALVDLDMPVMDGLTTAEHFQAQGVPVILMSGHPDIRHVVTEKEPISARLIKPVTLDELASAIRGVMEGGANGQAAGSD